MAQVLHGGWARRPPDIPPTDIPDLAQLHFVQEDVIRTVDYLTRMAEETLNGADPVPLKAAAEKAGYVWRQIQSSPVTVLPSTWNHVEIYRSILSELRLVISIGDSSGAIALSERMDALLHDFQTFVIVPTPPGSHFFHRAHHLDISGGNFISITTAPVQPDAVLLSLVVSLHWFSGFVPFVNVTWGFVSGCRRRYSIFNVSWSSSYFD